MLADLAVVCERCDAPLGEEDRQLTMRSAAGTRHAYECDCGALTVTVATDDANVASQ
ncbi:MAG: hypothetical protein ABEJ55_02920 [Halanaeroarchaeum sp.]